MRPVVVGVTADGGTRQAVTLAAREALKRGLPLRLVHGLWLSQYGGRSTALTCQRVRDGIREQLPWLAREARIDVVDADAVSALARAGDSAALVVVGAGPAGDLTLGSVSLGCLVRTACPVMIVPTTASGGQGPRRIVVGVDGGPASLSALAWAVSQANQSAAALEVVGVQVPEPVLRGLLVSSGAIRLPAHVRLAQSTEQVAEGLSADDLLVLGAQGHRSVLSLLLASNGDVAALRSPCPTVVVRAGQARRELHVREDQRPVATGPSTLVSTARPC